MCEAVTGWNNTKLRLEPPQRDKLGDSHWELQYVRNDRRVITIYIYMIVRAY